MSILQGFVATRGAQGTWADADARRVRDRGGALLGPRLRGVAVRAFVALIWMLMTWVLLLSAAARAQTGSPARSRVVPERLGQSTSVVKQSPQKLRAASTSAPLPESGLGGMASDPGRAVVRLMRRGVTLGAGVVLADGRVLTALSNLGHGHTLEVGLGYGASVPVAVSHTHRGWDLALLTPSEELIPGLLTADYAVQRARRAAGRVVELRLEPSSSTDLVQRHEVEFFPVEATELAVVYGVDGVVIERALLPRRSVSHFGAPLVDSYGLLTGIVVRVCAQENVDPCGAWRQAILPGAIIDKFLRQAPTREILPPAWAGLAGEGTDNGLVRGVRVNAIIPGSAAARARLRVGDVIVAVDERPVTTLLGLTLALRAKSNGEALELLVFRDGTLLAGQIEVSSPQQPTALQPAHGPPERPASGL